MPRVKYISFQTEQSNAISEANILCLGNFDGVHFAHRALLRQAKKLQAEQMPFAKCGVLCFERPSVDFLSSNPPKHLTTLEQKLKYFADEGMDFAFVANFEALQGLSPEDFVKDVFLLCAFGVCVAASLTFSTTSRVLIFFSAIKSLLKRNTRRD